jgi:hypothetical protein
MIGDAPINGVLHMPSDGGYIHTAALCVAPGNPRRQFLKRVEDRLRPIREPTVADTLGAIADALKRAARQ